MYFDTDPGNCSHSSNIRSDVGIKCQEIKKAQELPGVGLSATNNTFQPWYVSNSKLPLTQHHRGTFPISIYAHQTIFAWVAFR
ncbi:hypothetical protein TNCT_554991 [Trichonephila clavata]|uniref:Uncharacterized protein n=1 Tax=Trichonephila clavata TaxID=2740835 RepID=A0A8X6F617_TRICU|nr:hypothetical protein TNCT_554991 [Trichonephila clavata]